MTVRLDMEGEPGQNYSFLTNGLYDQALVIFYVLSWSTKFAIGAQAGYSAQSTKVATGAERVNQKTCKQELEEMYTV